MFLLREQKWSKAKSRDANANKVQFEEELYTRFMAEVPKVRPFALAPLPHAAQRNSALVHSWLARHRPF